MGEPEKYLKQALKLALKGRGLVSPNPLVGAVLVKNNRVIGRGWHRYFGGRHAEINALDDCRETPAGGTLYVTLEPCCHFGKTPPCTEAIIRSGVRKVVAGMTDPNPVVAGKGFAALRKAGIDVEAEHGSVTEQCRRINEPYLVWITRQRPFIALKIAQTLDGKIASRDGKSKWITGEKARDFARRLRFEYDAVLVGINTVLADDPGLNYQPDRLSGDLPGRKHYWKIVLDSRARLPLTGRIWTGANSRILVAVTGQAPKLRLKALEKQGALVITAGKERVELSVLMKQLAKLGIASVLVEGGAETSGSFVDEKLVDRLYLFQSPLVLGGRCGLSSVSGQGYSSPDKALRFDLEKTRRFGPDQLFVGKPLF